MVRGLGGGQRGLGLAGHVRWQCCGGEFHRLRLRCCWAPTALARVPCGLCGSGSQFCYRCVCGCCCACCLLVGSCFCGITEGVMQHSILSSLVLLTLSRVCPCLPGCTAVDAALSGSRAPPIPCCAPEASVVLPEICSYCPAALQPPPLHVHSPNLTFVVLVLGVAPQSGACG